MSLSVTKIKSTKTDKELFELISSELNARIPEAVRGDDEALLQALRRLPRGLRAMAAIHTLDVSVALDDLAWHFYNNHNLDLADETLWGLRELGASEGAKIFEQAIALVEPHWWKIGELIEQAREKDSSAAFIEWCDSSGLEAAMLPLDKRLWEICASSPGNSLLSYWTSYARKFPERLVEEESCPH